VLFAWVIGAVLALLGALCYGALSSRLSESGGEYLFLSRTIHPMVGFLAGWVSLFAGFTAPIAVAAAGLQAYLAPWFPGIDPRFIGTTAILFAGFLHGFRVSHGARAQNAFVGIKLVLIFGFIAYGFSQLSSLPTAQQAVGFTLPIFAVQLMYISFSYSGWNAAVYVAGEVREPRRNLPRALLLGTIVVTAIYLLLNTVFVYAAPVDQLAGRPDIGAAAAQALGGDGLANVVRVIIAIALLTSVSSMVMAGPRVYAKMADDRVFPRFFAFTSEVPAAAIWFQVFLAMIVLWFATLQELLGYVGFTLSLSTAVAVIGLILLRRKEGPEMVPIPGYPWVPGVFILATLTIGGLMLSTGQGEPIAGLVTILIGAGVYFLIRRLSSAST
jgi:APA family basic amino acid/polyamine antiporter